MSIYEKAAEYVFSKKMVFSLFLVLISLLAYGPGQLENTSGDTISIRYWPVSVLKHHTYTLNPFMEDLKQVEYTGITYLGTLYPRTNWGMGLFTIPFYAVADFFDIYGNTWNHDRISRVSRLNGMILIIISTLIMFHFLQNLVKTEVAFASSVLYALGTWNWSLGSQGLNTQTVAVLIHTVTLWFIWNLCQKGNEIKSSKDAAILGVIHAVIWSTRGQDLSFSLPVLLMLRKPKYIQSYLFALLSLVLPLCYVYKMVYGYYGGYGAWLIDLAPDWVLTRWNILPGFFGLLLSPNRGAIVFFPFLILIPFVWSRFLGATRIERVWKKVLCFEIPKLSAEKHAGIPESFSQILAFGCLAYFLSLTPLTFWHATWSYGARYLYDLTPFVWPVVTLMIQDLVVKKKPSLSAKRLGPTVRVLFIACGIWQVFVHGLGNRNFDIYVWNYNASNDDSDDRYWDFNDFMLTEVWNAGPKESRWSDAYERLKKFGF